MYKMNLEKMKEKVQGFHEELDNLQNTIVSKAKKNETVRKIAKEAKKAKDELEKNYNKVKKETKEEVMDLRNSLNDIISWTKISPENNKKDDKKYDKKERFDNSNAGNKNKENIEGWREGVDASTLTNSAIKYIKAKAKVPLEVDMPLVGKVGKVVDLLDSKTEKKVRNILFNHFSKYPLLKKNNESKMKLEIWNKAEFGSMISSLRTTMVDSLPAWASGAFKLLPFYKKANNILSNINKSLPNLEADEYEEIIFWYIWWVVKDAVSNKWWKITVEEYYKDISEYYPSKNSTQVSNDLLASGWSNYNMDKFWRYS